MGAVRLEKALAALAGRAEVSLSWKPFEIHPEVPPEGLPLSSLPYSPGELADMLDNLERHAAEEGLDFRGRRGESRIVNTHRALLAGCYAQAEEPGRFGDFHGALFRSHFTEGRDLGDPGVLRDVALSSRLDGSRMEAALDGGDYEHVLRETAAEARRIGVTAVPTYLFGSSLVIVGAQSAETLLKAAGRALSQA